MAALDAALDLLRRGFWPVPLHSPGTPLGPGKTASGKEPIGAAWGARRPTEASLRLSYATQPKAGLGLKLGPDCAPDGAFLVDLEVDAPEGEDSLLSLFSGEVVPTMEWCSTKGKHRLYTVDPADVDALRSLPGALHLPSLPGLEIRLGNGKQLQSACPPTTTADGYQRAWTSQEPPATLPRLAVDRILFDHRAPTTLPKLSPAPGSTALRTTTPTTTGAVLEVSTSERAWYLAALRREAEKVAATPEGSHQRRNALNRAGYLLGGHLHHGHISEDEIVRELFDAAKLNGLPEAEIIDTLRRAIQDGASKPLPLPDVLSKSRRAGAEPLSNGQHHDDATPASVANLPSNMVKVGPDRDRMLGETVAILARDSDWFTRGDQLVRVILETEDDAKLPQAVKLGRAKGTARVAPIDSAALMGCLITKYVYYYSTDKDGDAFQVNPPNTLMSGLATSGEYPGVRPLISLAETPFPRFDGSIVTEPGYDQETGAYLSPYPPIDPIPEHPMQEDARQAVDTLLDLVRQFPFASDDDKIVWLTGLLTVVARPGISGPVPGVAVIGNKAGTGKGRLVDLIGVIALGRQLPTMSYPSQPEEAEKLKLSLALSGVALVHFDNVEEGTLYGSGPLDSALTSSTVSGRILGQSRQTEAVPLRTSWFLTGNGISPGKDAYRRWLPCSLATELEHPEEREDIEETRLLEHALSRRPELLRAALLILVAHAKAGRPGLGKPPLGSFEAWDEVVRGAVHYATGRDAIATHRIAADDAPERIQRIALLRAWSGLTHGGHDGGGLTCAEVLRIALKHETDPAALAIHDALVALTRDGKLPSVNVIGCTLRAMKGRNIDGLAFVPAKSTTKGVASLWHVRRMGEKPKPKTAESPKDPIPPVWVEKLL